MVASEGDGAKVSKRDESAVLLEVLDNPFSILAAKGSSALVSESEAVVLAVAIVDESDGSAAAVGVSDLNGDGVPGVCLGVIKGIEGRGIHSYQAW